MARGDLKEFRKQHGETQEEFANHCGITRSCYSLIELGVRRGSEQFWDSLQARYNVPDADLRSMMKRK